MKKYENNPEKVWPCLRSEAQDLMRNEPLLAELLTRYVLQRANLGESLAFLLSDKLSRYVLDAEKMRALFIDIQIKNPTLEKTAALDLLSVLNNDPAAKDIQSPLLFFKGYHALQAARMAHVLWHSGQNGMALYLQSIISEAFNVDIHPAAKIGHGITLDHASGIVIGETAIVGNNVLILHDVTLGTKGFTQGDRHPIVEDNVIIGVGAKIIGRIVIGKGAIIAAGSVVLEDVPAGATMAGVPARIVKTS